LFQVMMVLQNRPQEEREIKDSNQKNEEAGIEVARFDLTVNLTEGREGIAGSMVYSLDLYEGEAIRRMVGHFERVMEEVVRDAEQRIREIELMSQAERRQIVEEWNETERGYGEIQLVHELIAEQARERGEAIAVKGEQGELSYGELNRRANRV